MNVKTGEIAKGAMLDKAKMLSFMCGSGHSNRKKRCTFGGCFFNIYFYNFLFKIRQN